MAVPTETVQAIAVTGVRESLVDDVNILSKAESLFYDACKATEKPKNYKHEFLFDTIRAGADNGKIQGDDLTSSAATQPTRLYNQCQTIADSYTIASISNAVTSAGRSSEKDAQRLKFMKGLIKDTEYAFLKGVRVDPAAGTAGKMRGALNWCTTNLSKAADGTLEATGAITGGTARDLDATLLKDVLQLIYTAGGGRKTLQAHMNVFQQERFDAMLTMNNNRQQVLKGQIDDYVDLYKTAFGSVQAVINTEMPTDAVLISDMSYWKKGTLEPMSETLAEQGLLFAKYDIGHTVVLEACNELASGRITNLTTA